MIQVSLVPTQYINTCWGKVEPFMEKAAVYTYGRYTSDDIYDCVKDGSHQLWVAYEDSKFKGAVVTNVACYPKRKLLAMAFCGGYNLSEWKAPMLAILQSYAKNVGCDGIESTARRGWAKIFKSDGYKQHWVTFELPV